ncbi:MAG: Tm-1-like ATP-binding domain-containing protein, partial [Gemmatimonadota bacterium]
RAATGPARVLLPLRGVSALDATGQPFDDPEARQTLLETIERGLPAEQVERLDMHLNDVEFGERAARALIDLMRRRA